MEKDYKTEMRAMTEGLAEWCLRRKRRQMAVRTAISVAAVTATVIIALLPDPDGHYISNAQTRTETLHTIEQTTLIAKL